MISKHLWATTATFLALSAVGPSSLGVWAQTATQAVCGAGFQWNENSLGQDPCSISSILDATCRGIGSYTIPVLNSTQNYVPPQADNTFDLTCDCNTIMYSLYMACTTCQGGVIYSWTKWIAQCGTVYVTQYPVDVAYGTAIPHWAFYDVTTLPNQTYSDTVAEAAGRDPEATPKAISTGNVKTSTSGKFSATSSPGSNPTGNSSGNSSSGPSGGSKVNIAAIVGGVVGGVVVLSLIALLVFFLARRKPSRPMNQLPPPPPQMYLPQETSEYQKVPPSPMPSPGIPNPGIPNPSLTSPGPTSPVLSYNASYYNPNDPTTFPPPMGDGHSSVSYPNPMSPNGQGGPGRYGGMPEL